MARASNKIPLTEKQFEAQVKDLAKIFGWKYYHTWRSIHSPAGFPDCVLVRPPRLIFAELKSEKGSVSEKQQEWLDILKACQERPKDFALEYAEKRGYVLIPEVYIWRPDDIEEIVECLR